MRLALEAQLSHVGDYLLANVQVGAARPSVIGTTRRNHAPHGTGARGPRQASRVVHATKTNPSSVPISTPPITPDTLAVQYVFPKETTGDYNAARVVGVTLLYLTAAMTQVMFPKIVRSAARLEKSDALMLALGASAVMGVLGCLACTLLPALPLRILWGEKYIHMAWLVPWFAWCILPVSLAGVLVNNLLARERYAVVPWLLVVGVGYAVALRFFHGDFVTVVRAV